VDLTAANASYLEGEEVERKAKKGSFRESMVLPMKNLRESMLISAEEREAALAKIDEMLGNTGLFVCLFVFLCFFLLTLFSDRGRDCKDGVHNGWEGEEDAGG
jgi:hypothetical protein